jgi:hypothetical protein
LLMVHLKKGRFAGFAGVSNNRPSPSAASDKQPTAPEVDAGAVIDVAHDAT